MRQLNDKCKMINLTIRAVTSFNSLWTFNFFHYKYRILCKDQISNDLMIWLCILWTYVDSKNQEIITQQHSFTKININSAIISSILRILYVSKNSQSKMTNCMTRFLKIWYRRWVTRLKYYDTKTILLKSFVSCSQMALLINKTFISNDFFI